MKSEWKCANPRWHKEKYACLFEEVYYAQCDNLLCIVWILHSLVKLFWTKPVVGKEEFFLLVIGNIITWGCKPLFLPSCNDI